MPHNRGTVFTIAMRLMILLVLSTFMLLERGLIPVTRADDEECAPLPAPRNNLGDNWFDCDYIDNSCTHVEWVGAYDISTWTLCEENTYYSECSEEEQEECFPILEG